MTRAAEVFEAPEAKLAQVQIDDATVARLRERAGEPMPVDTTLQRRAIERDLAPRVLITPRGGSPPRPTWPSTRVSTRS